MSDKCIVVVIELQEFPGGGQRDGPVVRANGETRLCRLEVDEDGGKGREVEDILLALKLTAVDDNAAGLPEVQEILAMRGRHWSKVEDLQPIPEGGGGSSRPCELHSRRSSAGGVEVKDCLHAGSIT